MDLETPAKPFGGLPYPKSGFCNYDVENRSSPNFLEEFWLGNAE